jgi:23S rRNA (uracil1939-C5)-methyltransferase
MTRQGRRSPGQNAPAVPAHRRRAARVAARGGPTPQAVARVLDWAPTGDGLAEVGDECLQVPGVIPGEEVEIVWSPGSRRRVARVVRVVTPSPHRVAPDCRHSGECGGCSWQHVAYPEQLRVKRAWLQAALDESLGRESVGVAPVVSAWATGEVPRGFRDKAHFVVARGGRAGDLVVGHYRRGTQHVLPVSECPVHAPRANAVAFRLFDALARAGAVGAGEDVRRGGVRHLVVRAARHSGEALATLVVTRSNDPAVRSAVRSVLASGPAPDGVHVNLHAEPGSHLFGHRTKRVAGRERLLEHVAGVRFLVSPTSFFQTHVGAADALARRVLDAVPPGARVLDLYAGAGLFSLPLARRGHAVVAIEESAGAVSDGEASRAANRLEPAACRFVRGRVEDVLARIARRERARFTVVILDPPRQGCQARVLELVADEVRPDRVIYVSCHPEALSRDLARLLRTGTSRYRLASVVPIDMFPHTPHIEAVAVLDVQPR